MQTKVIECASTHYEVQDVEMGKVYRWRPANVLVECNCGEEPTLSALRTTCEECGADHAPIGDEVLQARPAVKAITPGTPCSHTRPRGVPREDSAAESEVNGVR